MTAEPKFSVVPDEVRTAPRGKWGEMWVALDEGKTVFMAGDRIATAVESMRPRTKGTDRVLRSRRVTIDDVRGTAIWLEPKA